MVINLSADKVKIFNCYGAIRANTYPVPAYLESITLRKKSCAHFQRSRWSRVDRRSKFCFSFYMLSKK